MGHLSPPQRPEKCGQDSGISGLSQAQRSSHTVGSSVHTYVSSYTLHHIERKTDFFRNDGNTDRHRCSIHVF